MNVSVRCAREGCAAARDRPVSLNGLAAERERVAAAAAAVALQHNRLVRHTAQNSRARSRGPRHLSDDFFFTNFTWGWPIAFARGSSARIAALDKQPRRD